MIPLKPDEAAMLLMIQETMPDSLTGKGRKIAAKIRHQYPEMSKEVKTKKK